MPDDEQFFERADAHIQLSNTQLQETDADKVSASMMYATARFNAWLTTRGFDTSEQMKQVREQNIGCFVTNYRRMLKENMDDYIENFADYMKRGENNSLRDSC